MSELDYDYASGVRNSERVAWKLDELMPEGTHLVAAQHAGYRDTFLVDGMTNSTFREDLAKISNDAPHRVSDRAKEVT
jgi:hypothetical protein